VYIGVPFSLIYCAELMEVIAARFDDQLHGRRPGHYALHLSHRGRVTVTSSLLLSVLACCLTWAQASAQDVDNSRPAPTNVRGAEYPRIHSDNRVTFRLKAPEARKVQLQPNDGAVENGLGKGPYNMVRGDDGVW